ncbi:integral membrane protein-like protein [Cucurbitaria berberidis CBS 394.84]|uniref:Integral membrane protein-like protein n=1 Tax=Cucurbitaria berberidis CBS 394.84 TaxID=1168544 RepID=A0A9P4GTB1_9PLEO|nr:integral membrane protein-like protein [Cucurbitaria berberidis CBS 394.84]KAF1852163.1 integral membrane protein-like protein [Cucurbitaria berberidis CBS 394.84]
MAAPEAQEAAAKQRIIKHMNADHHDSIRRYVEAYASKSTFQSRDAQMTDIDLGEMKFSCGGQQVVVTFDPPMTALREARERLVQMDKDSLQALGRSDISVTTFIPATAKPGHLYNFTQCVLAYLLLPRPANFRPGSLLYESLLYKVPSIAAFIAQIAWIVFAIMLPLHIGETVLMARKLAKHGCSPADGVWWKWMGTCFVEGITSFWRLDGLIEGKRREKEAKKH